MQRDQIALPFQWPVADRDEDFLVSDANRDAFTHFTRWSLWPVMATLLTGPRKSGRSLLAQIFVRKTNGRVLDHVEDRDPPVMCASALIFPLRTSGSSDFT